MDINDPYKLSKYNKYKGHLILHIVIIFIKPFLRTVILLLSINIYHCNKLITK